MRPSLKLRKTRRAQVIVGVIMLAIPTSAVALSAGSAGADRPLPVTFDRQSISYGQSLIATGVTRRSQGGRKLLMELAPSGGPWRVVASAIVHSDGRFRIRAAPQQSGKLRVRLASSAAHTRLGSAARDISSGGTPSAPRTVEVSAALEAQLGSIVALSGVAVDLRGTLLPRVPGRLVRLQARLGRAWRTLRQARTRANGHFSLRYVTRDVGQRALRLSFGGDRLNAASTTRSGRLTVFRPSAASWYDDAGATGCGFHARFGVANKVLPCGSTVTFHYGSRSVTAVVDDRGPYVGDREWDLNQNTAAALGFNGVDTVWSSR